MNETFGHLIVIEGIDGTGKSTQVKALAEYLRAQGREVVTSFEPTNGQHGKRLRDSMLTGRLSADEELRCFIDDRKEHVETLILPSLEAGKDVILDRYYFSTMAYQGASGFDVAAIRAENETFSPQPHLLIILDLDVDDALIRIQARNVVTNEFEKRENLETCRSIFLSLAQEPFVKIISAKPNADAVTATLLKTVNEFFQS